jgi:hypothetical protein
MRRDGDAIMGPGPEVALAADDELLLAGHGAARRALETTMLLDAAAARVISGETLHASWVWRKLADRRKRNHRGDAGREPAA